MQLHRKHRMSPHGRNIDDFSGTFGNHRRNRLSATVKYGRKISLNDPVPVLICHISQKINIGNTCIVDEYIKMCTFLINFIVNCPYVVRISYITRYKCTWSMVFFGDICPELLTHLQKKSNSKMYDIRGKRIKVRCFSDASGSTCNKDCFLFHNLSPPDQFIVPGYPNRHALERDSRRRG